MSTERSEVDMIFPGLTIHYVYLLTIWHLYNVQHYAVLRNFIINLYVKNLFS